MDEIMRQILNITAISMVTIFAVMTFLYVAIRIMVRGKE